MIADSLGLAYETKRLLPKQKYILGKPRFRVSLAHLDLNHSDPLTPPWPELIITVGRRPYLVAIATFHRRNARGSPRRALRPAPQSAPHPTIFNTDRRAHGSSDVDPGTKRGKSAHFLGQVEALRRQAETARCRAATVAAPPLPAPAQAFGRFAASPACRRRG